jgi:hypothetical protein
VNRAETLTGGGGLENFGPGREAPAPMGPKTGFIAPGPAPEDRITTRDQIRSLVREEVDTELRTFVVPAERVHSEEWKAIIREIVREEMAEAKEVDELATAVRENLKEQPQEPSVEWLAASEYLSTQEYEDQYVHPLGNGGAQIRLWRHERGSDGPDRIIYITPAMLQELLPGLADAAAKAR